MLPYINKKSIKIVQDINKAIMVMRDAGRWLQKSGKKPSKWWQLQNLNRKFLLQYAKPKEFYVLLINNIPAAAAILQFNQNCQDWYDVDKNHKQTALYIHWLCVSSRFAAKGMPKLITNFAEQKAKEKNVKLLRADTNADILKLRKVYENLGFKLVSIKKEDYRRTALYEKRILT